MKLILLIGLAESEVEGKGVVGGELGTSEDVTRQQQRSRKQELKLDLDVNAPPLMLHNLPTSGTPATSEDSSENSMIWQRLPMGTGGDSQTTLTAMGGGGVHEMSMLLNKVKLSTRGEGGVKKGQKYVNVVCE